jgi:hypothetical protein
MPNVISRVRLLIGDTADSPQFTDQQILERLAISGDVRVSNLIRRRENAPPVVVRWVVRFSQAPLQGAGSARHAIVHTGVHTG